VTPRQASVEATATAGTGTSWRRVITLKGESG